MADILIKWTTGDGNIVVSESGGDVLISSDTPNFGVERSQVLTFKTDVGDATAELLVTQKAMSGVIILRSVDGDILRDSDQKVLTAKE